MFNVLPDILKKEIKTDYQLHKWFVIVVAIFFLQVTFLISFLPSWVNSYSKEKELTDQVSSMSKSSSYQNADAASSVIESTNAKLKIISTNLGYPKITPLIKSILTNKAQGILISEIIYASSNATSAVISFGGVSNSRESLIKYADTLEQSKTFKKVDLPISNLAKNKDIDFSINLIISQ
jgi:hypothetical protein